MNRNMNQSIIINDHVRHCQCLGACNKLLATIDDMNFVMKAII